MDYSLPTAALAVLRRGYPQLSAAEQAHGLEFRVASRLLTDWLAAETLKVVGELPAVLISWPAGLVFAESYAAAGAASFLHLHFHRDERSLETVIDLAFGELGMGRPVVIVEPMLATGNSIVEAIRHLIGRGIAEALIVVNAILASPEGVERIQAAYPAVRVLYAGLDEGVDECDYIVPGLGDFQAKYFDGYSAEEEGRLSTLFNLPADLEAVLHSTLFRHALGDTLTSLVIRDRKDAEISAHAQEEIKASGLAIQVPRHRLEIDTGLVHGVVNVVDRIVAEIERIGGARIVAVEGVSGTGKSTTAQHLQERLAGASVSLGEIFRYLAFHGGEAEHILSTAHYRFGSAGLELWHENRSVTGELAQALRQPRIEHMVSQVAATAHAPVLQFAARELAALVQGRQVDRTIIIEGRGWGLDFLPSDLRVILTADPVVRAQRRSGS